VRRREELGVVTLVLHHAEGGTDTWQRGGRTASMAKTLWCMAAMPSLRGQLSNRWRAQFRVSWTPFMGWIWAKFGHGPNTKFVMLIMLYNFD
jgi:hypothetical protein